MTEYRDVLERLSAVKPPAEPGKVRAVEVPRRYADRVTRGTWTEVWPDEEGRPAERTVTAEIWTAAIQAALDENAAVALPRRDEPYYIDAPLVVRSGNRLIADPQAEIRLKPRANCCMVRNANIRDGGTGPLSLDEHPDTDIVIEGGIWTTLATLPREFNGNMQGRCDTSADALGANGTIVLHNVRGGCVRNVTIRQCRPYGVHLGQCSDFLVENVRLEDTRRDGVHVNGPADRGVIRNVSGVTGDDVVALNGWDWKNATITFGPVSNVLVEDVTGCVPGPCPEVRILGGTKHYEDGSRLACDSSDCVFRRIRAIETFKMYDQPNLELGRDLDFADPIGTLRNLHFDDVHLDRPTPEAPFQIASNVDGLTIRNVTLAFDPDSPKGVEFKLVRIGPLSMTFKHDPTDTRRWVEVFSPDKDCTVRNLRIADVQAAPADGSAVRSIGDTRALVEVIRQTVNEDYPNTTPRGGTGRGILVE